MINPYTLWLFNIAMENGPFIDGLSIKNGDFHGYVKSRDGIPIQQSSTSKHSSYQFVIFHHQPTCIWGQKIPRLVAAVWRSQFVLRDNHQFR